MSANDKKYAKEYNKLYYKNNKEKWDKRRKARATYQKGHRAAMNAYQNKYAKKDVHKHRIRKSFLINKIKADYGCLNPDCMWSGELKPCCLDFHHLDNDNKTYVSQMLNSSYVKICEEINKCTLLCATCHRLATYAELDCSELTRCVVSKDAIQAAKVLEC